MTTCPRHFIFEQSAGNEGQDLFCKGDDNAPRQGEKPVGPLAGVVALEGKPHLDDTPAQQDHPHCPNEAEDKVGQLVDDRQRVAAGPSGKGCH